MVEAANKNLTGTVEISAKDSTGRDLAVSVYLEAGQVRGVSASGWTAPAGLYVLHATGQDLTAEADPLRAAYAAESAPGVPLLDADAIDAIRRDWGYGLLAATLTWNKPKIKKVKGGTYTGDKFVASPWAMVVTDLASRVESINQHWAVVCRELASAGITPRPAAQAAPMLGVSIFGHPVFDGSEPLDRIAGLTGQSRAAILAELASAILAGGQPQFFPLTPEGEHLWIPEHWDDPAGAFGAVPNVSVTPATKEPTEADEAESWGALLNDQDQPTTETPQTLAQQDEAVEAEAWGNLLDAPEEATIPAIEPAPAPEPAPEPPAAEQEWDFDTPQNTPTEPEPEPLSWDETALTDELTPEPTSPTTEPGDDRLLDEFVTRAHDDYDRDVRTAVAQRVIDAAVAEVAARETELAAAHTLHGEASAAAQHARTALDTAKAALAAAHEALATAEHEVEQAKAHGAALIAAEQEAKAAAAHAAQTKAERDHEVERVKAALAAAEAQALAAKVAAEEAEVEANEAAHRVATEVQPAIDAAQAKAEQVRSTQVDPASAEHDASKARYSEATTAEEAAQGQVVAAQDAVNRAQQVVAYLVADAARQAEQGAPAVPATVTEVNQSHWGLDAVPAASEADVAGFEFEQPVPEVAPGVVGAQEPNWDAPGFDADLTFDAPAQSPAPQAEGNLEAWDFGDMTTDPAPQAAAPAPAAEADPLDDWGFGEVTEAAQPAPAPAFDGADWAESLPAAPATEAFDAGWADDLDTTPAPQAAAPVTSVADDDALEGFIFGGE